MPSVVSLSLQDGSPHPVNPIVWPRLTGALSFGQIVVRSQASRWPRLLLFLTLAVTVSVGLLVKGGPGHAVRFTDRPLRPPQYIQRPDGQARKSLDQVSLPPAGAHPRSDGGKGGAILTSE